MKKQFQLAIAVIAASQLGATDCGQVLRDPGFDLWCGEELCTWKSVRGDVERVGTWHESDSGVSFLGSDSAIQQVAPVNSSDGTCIVFSLVANVSPGVDMFLNIDIEADGSVERQERIPASSWAPISFYIHITPPYDGIRFELAKSGSGEAVLANIGAEIFEGSCSDITPIEPGPRPNGAACFDNGECESGICTESLTAFPGEGSFSSLACAGCNPTTTCDTGEVCGVDVPQSPVLAVPTACVLLGAKELGEQCVTDTECASNICTEGTFGAGVCSACNAASECAGAACAPAWVRPTTILLPGLNGPQVCQPGAGLGVTGVGCGTDADCASGTCAGSERKQCDDGRSCRNPGDCPITSGLAPGPCTTVGVQGGSCT